MLAPGCRIIHRDPPRRLGTMKVDEGRSGAERFGLHERAVQSGTTR